MAAVGAAYRAAGVVDDDEVLAGIEAEYRALLAEPAVLPFSRWEPVRIGPTWQITPEGLWLLPERTLGWGVLAWCTRWLERAPGEPWWFTAEQARWLLWWYAVDENGSFLYTDAVLQRLKGWGKDPLGACLCMVEMLGPCRFGGWAADGSPIGVECREAWVATAAVSQDQTRNTMRLLPTLISEDCLQRYRMQVGKESVNALGDTRRLEAVTSSPRSLQGRRHTTVLLNEALALDTPLPTPGGWTTMGAVRPGDQLVGADGRPTAVTAATDVQIDRTCYRLHLADGTTVVASDGHLWLTKVAGSQTAPRVRTTQELVEHPRTLRVPRAGALHTPAVELPLDPYILGLWLGDGDSRNAVVTAAETDIDEVMDQVRARGCTAHRLASSRAPRFYVSVPDARRYRADPSPVRGVLARLRDMELLGAKHIPEQYLRAGTEQRIELLRGLMDSDGCVTQDGYCIFVATDDAIAGATLELLRSLGQCPRTTWTHDVRSRRGGYHRIGFTPRQILPVSLPRKVARLVPAKAESDWVSIAKIEPVDSVPVRCVAVDAPDHLFLAGPGWTVTHNTHEWVAANEGHAMTDVLTDNAVKSPGGAARTVRITNAYMPGEDSVAERDRDAWAAGQSGEAEDPGILYDSLEAHPEAPLIVTVRRRDDGELVASDHEADGEVDDDATREATRLAIVEVISTVRGDAWWLSAARILKRVLDVRSPPSRSRRFWFNQVVAAEDAWLDPRDVDANADRDLILAPGEPVVVFGDLSKSDDATGLEACRLSDGATFTLRVWTPQRRKGDVVSRYEVKRALLDAAQAYRVVACWIDPSAVQDEETGQSYWLPMLDELHRELGPRLEVWPVATGARRHALIWDMRSSQNDRLFTEAAEAYVADTEAGECPHDAHPVATAHLKNARRRPNRWGVGLGKEHRESAKKVDLAVCKVGARMLRRIVLNRRAEQDKAKPRTGFVV